jgi:hypothetical protein
VRTAAFSPTAAGGYRFVGQHGPGGMPTVGHPVVLAGHTDNVERRSAPTAAGVVTARGHGPGVECRRVGDLVRAVTGSV